VGLGEIPDLARFAQWARRAGFTVVQILPVNAIAGPDPSPYRASSAFALDPVYLSLDACEDFAAAGGRESLSPEEQGLLASLNGAPRIDWDAVRRLKKAGIQRAFDRFLRDEWQPQTRRARELAAFDREHQSWLDDYSLFASFMTDTGRAGRTGRRPPATAIPTLSPRPGRPTTGGSFASSGPSGSSIGNGGRRASRRAAPASSSWAICLSRSREIQRTSGRGAGCSGPISALARHPSQTPPRDRTGGCRSTIGPRWPATTTPGSAAGRPAPATSSPSFGSITRRASTGPTTDPPTAKRALLPPDEYHQVRLGENLMRLLGRFGEVIAEDLGPVPQFLRPSLDRLGVPGYRVLRWEKDGDDYRDPAQWPECSVATNATHDTEPTAVWYEGQAREDRERLRKVPGLGGLDVDKPFEEGARDLLLRVVYASPSRLALVTFQDALGARERINTPGTSDAGDWTFRMPMTVDELLADEGTIERLANLALDTDRAKLK